MKFLDEIEIGERQVLGSYRFEQDDIIAFARKYDPQPFHVDPEAARRTHFGALVASGWQTAAVWMKLFVAFNERHVAERVAKGLPVPELGPSPGFRKLRWLKPVYAGDTLTYATEARGKANSKSRPQFGMLSAYNSASNQDGTLVFDFESMVFLQRQPG